MSEQPPTLDQHIATAQHLAEFSTEATDPGAATSSIAHSLCALSLRLAGLTGIISDGVTAIQQHLPLATTDRRHSLAMQEQVVAAIRDLTQVIRADGAARAEYLAQSAASEAEKLALSRQTVELHQKAVGDMTEARGQQPETVAAPEGRYLQRRCDCTLSMRYQWYVDEFCWRDDRSGDPPKGFHCERCGAKLPSAEWCAQRGLEPGTAVAFAPVGESDEGPAKAALERANAKLANVRHASNTLTIAVYRHQEVAYADVDAGPSWRNVTAAMCAIANMDLSEEAATDGH